MSLARATSPTAFKTSISVFQLTGLPFPSIQSFRISKLICFASSWCFETIALIVAPVSSFNSRIPNSKYFVLICSGMLIVCFLLGNLRSFSKFGLSPADTKWQDHIKLGEQYMQGHNSKYVYSITACPTSLTSFIITTSPIVMAKLIYYEMSFIWCMQPLATTESIVSVELTKYVNGCGGRSWWRLRVNLFCFWRCYCTCKVENQILSF